MVQVHTDQQLSAMPQGQGQVWTARFQEVNEPANHVCVHHPSFPVYVYAGYQRVHTHIHANTHISTAYLTT